MVFAAYLVEAEADKIGAVLGERAGDQLRKAGGSRPVAEKSQSARSDPSASGLAGSAEMQGCSAISQRLKPYRSQSARTVAESPDSTALK